MMNQSTQGLASLGRNGDTMLMHVSPREVQGLQGLAMSHGGSLTINPHTGLPEAFSFGRFLSSLLPAAAGFMMGGPGGAAMGLEAGSTAATLAPIVAGAATGGILAGAQGDNAIMGMLTGGLGGYGGGNIASSMGRLGASQAAGNVASNAGNAASTVGGAGNVGMANSFALGPADTLGQAASYAQPAANLGASANTINPFAGGYAGESSIASTSPFDTSMGNINTGFKELTGQGNMSIGDAFDKYSTPVKEGGAGGSKFQLASTVGFPALQEAMRIEPTAMIDMEAVRKAKEDKYRDPITGRLNLSPDTGLRLAAQGGLINSYALGGPIEATSGSSVYGNPDGTIAQQTPKDDYGIGRLNNLASAQSINQASLTGYAMGGLTSLKPGGYLDGAGDGMSDSIPATIDGKQQARLADGEFVVPADVVSHIGNGSSKAGSQRLYSMLDKIRQARTGNKKQGKQINPNKYMPA